MTVEICITGTLSIPRSEAITLIETKTNGRFNSHLTYSISYLVASKFDSNKAKKAAKLGTCIISEKEMMEFIEQGYFPPTKLPEKPKLHCEFKIDWDEIYDPPKSVFLEYSKDDGEVTERYLSLSAKGKSDSGKSYIGGFHAGQFKTFRADRVLRLEEL